MSILEQSGSQIKTWDLSYAKGTYSQTLQNTPATGEIIDLGGLKLVNGKEYPFLMAEGKAFFRRSGSNKQPIEESTNGNFSIQHEEQVWSSADGNVIISQIEGVFGFVLDPRRFPRDLRVIGVLDSMFVYPYSSE